MSTEINGKEIDGVLGLILAIPIIIVTFTAIAVAFLTVVALLLSPFIFVIWLIAR